MAFQGRVVESMSSRGRHLQLAVSSSRLSKSYDSLECTWSKWILLLRRLCEGSVLYLWLLHLLLERDKDCSCKCSSKGLLACSDERAHCGLYTVARCNRRHIVNRLHQKSLLYILTRLLFCCFTTRSVETVDLWGPQISRLYAVGSAILVL